VSHAVLAMEQAVQAVPREICLLCKHIGVGVTIRVRTQPYTKRMIDHAMILGAQSPVLILHHGVQHVVCYFVLAAQSNTLPPCAREIQSLNSSLSSLLSSAACPLWSQQRSESLKHLPHGIRGFNRRRHSKTSVFVERSCGWVAYRG
jgi:hypothetical protein